MNRLFPGDRRVWLTAVALAIAFGGVILYELARPREYLTGTNSVRSRSVVAELREGQRLCVPGLDIPAGTGRVELDLVTTDPRPALHLKLRVGSQLLRGMRSAEPSPDSRKASVSVPEVSSASASTSGSLCVRAEGPGRALIGGMLQLQSGQASPTLDGKYFGSRVSVWFRPPAGERRSILGLWPDIARRAALFRPGVVGPWTYSVLFLLIAPAAAYLGIRTLARAASGIASARSLVIGIGSAALLSATSWSVITPAFDAPDETDHFAYAQYLAETGNAPCQSCLRRARSTEQQLASDSLRIYSHIEASDGHPPWLDLDESRWRHAAAAVDLRRDDGGGPTTAATHTPVYYSALLPAYAAAHSHSIFSRLHAMRLVSALLGALTAMCVFLTVRELLPGRSLVATAAGLLVAFQPMVGFISGALNNDAAVNAASALAILLLVRALRRNLTIGVGVAMAAVLVLVPLTKVTGYAVYPAAVIGLGVVAWRSRHSFDIRPWAALIATFAALQIAWKLVSPLFDRTAFATPGGGVPGTQGPIADALKDLPGLASYVWQIFLPQLPFMADLHQQAWPAYDIYVERGFAAFGWYAFTFPTGIYVVIVAAMLTIGVLAATTLRRERVELAGIRIELALLLLIIVCVIGGVEASYFSKAADRAVVSEQGRYAFTALVPLALVAVGGCYALGRRRAVWIASSLTVAMIGLNYASQWMFVSTAYS